MVMDRRRSSPRPALPIRWPWQRSRLPFGRTAEILSPIARAQPPLYTGVHRPALPGDTRCLFHALARWKNKGESQHWQTIYLPSLAKGDMGGIFELDISCGACNAHTHTRAKWISVKSNVEDFKTALILNGLRVAPASNTTNEQGCKRLDPARIQGELFVRVAR